MQFGLFYFSLKSTWRTKAPAGRSSNSISPSCWNLATYPKSSNSRQDASQLKSGTSIPWLGRLLPTVDLGFLSRGLRHLAFFHGLQLIEKRLVADAKDLCRLAPVPARLGKHTLDGFTFGLHGSAAAD